MLHKMSNTGLKQYTNTDTFNCLASETDSNLDPQLVQTGQVLLISVKICPSDLQH